VVRRAKLSAAVVRKSELEKTIRLDSEYYQPEYLLQEEKISRFKAKRLSEFAMIFDGNHMTIEDKFIDAGIRYLRGQDLSNFFISDENPVFIPKDVYDDLERSHIKSGDVLLSIIGTIGNAALVTDKYSKLTGSCKIAIIRPHTVSPYLLAAYLASSIGQAQIARRVRGAVQQGLILPDLKNLLIPSFNERLAVKVENLIKQARKSQKESEDLYNQAQTLLITELGLDKLDLPREDIAIRRLSEIAPVSRIDAEYYHPHKAYAQRWLDKLPGRTISAHFKSVREIYNPPKANTGKSILNFDLNDALRYFVDEAGLMMPENEIGSIKKRMKNGDVIVSRLRSYLKEIALVEVSNDVEAVGSSEFVVLRPKSTEVCPEVLAAYLRSEPVQIILKWSQDGSNHPRFQEEELLAIKLPDRVLKLQGEIRRLIRAGIEAYRDAQRLLSEAKAEVERMIEMK